MVGDTDLKFHVDSLFMKNIFVFGDSIAFGSWDPEGGWVERLRKWLFINTHEDCNLNNFLYNLSIPGDTTADILKRFKHEIQPRGGGDVVLFAVGINNSQFVAGKPILTPSQTRAHVRELVTLAQELAPTICWVGLTPVDESRTNPIYWMQQVAYRNEAITVFDAAIKNATTEVQIPYLDIFREWTADENYSNFLVDGIHPDAAGHEKIFEQVKKFLESVEKYHEKTL